MFDIIASSFFQKKTCHLPGIGKLSFENTYAETDLSNARIKAPQQSIIFTPTKTNEHIFNEFSAISEMMQQKLNRDGTLNINGIGTFIKDNAGNIHFIPVELDAVFAQPVSAIPVIRKNAEYSVLVGDNQTTNTVINKKYNDETENTFIKKSYWWIWAIVFAVTGLLLIAIYIYNSGVNNLGNCTPL